MYKHKDLPILANLRKNGRISLTKISRKTGVPISTIFDRMKHHWGRGIKKYTALLDFNEFGFTTRVHLLVSLPKDKRDEARIFLMKHQNVNSLYKINNNFDFLVEAVFKHIKNLEDFIDALETRFLTETVEVHHIIDDIKRESFMEDSKLAKLLLDDRLL
tara:strand:- start:851 stop:1330 length:480 start_codon:yes stop_codon:yes gene_type:complete